MIERVYLDNLWTFVNFEWRPGSLAILMGANGSGKTNLAVALRDVQAFLLGQASTVDAFDEHTRTRWEKQRREQTIEIDVRDDGGSYRYRLVVEHHAPGKNRIASETLHHDDRLLIEFVGGELRLFRDDGSAGPRLQAKETRSAVGAIEPGDDDRRLAWFKEWILKLWLVEPDPRAMSARVERKAAGWLAPDLANFGAWYLKTLSAKPGSIFKATAALGTVLPGFLDLHDEAGYLHARFGDDSASDSFRFDELSEGQRMLIALYVLRYAVAGPRKTLLIDEPDNYVSLREIQPWVTEMTDLALAKGGPQILDHQPPPGDPRSPRQGLRLALLPGRHRADPRRAFPARRRDGPGRDRRARVGRCLKACRPSCSAKACRTGSSCAGC